MSGNTVKRKARAQEIRGSNASTVLSKIFRRMLVYVAGTVDVDETNIDKIPVEHSAFMDHSVSSGKYEQFMTNFVSDPRNCIPQNKKEQSSARGNLQKEMLKSGMSWKVFVKSLRFLDLTGFDIQITAHYRNGNHSIHTEHINLSKSLNLPENIIVPKHSAKGYFESAFKPTLITPDIQNNVRRAYDITQRNNPDLQSGNSE